MAILEFISDDDFFAEVETVIDIAVSARRDSDLRFGRNVIDPFAATFEMAGFDLSHQQWKEAETVRQAQKTLQNSIGSFHQKILGHVDGWEDLGIGSEIDLQNTDQKIVAEVKNKYNTVSGGKLKDVYDELEQLVMPRASRFKGYTAYFVNIIPKTPGRFNMVFTPSNRATGNRYPDNPLIRIIDGASFYHLVTGRENALQELFSALPKAIDHLQSQTRSSVPKEDVAQLNGYFSAAYSA